MANQIRFNVGFQVDRTGLNELQSALAQVQTSVNNAAKTGNLTNELKTAGQAATQLSNILNQSWNNKLGQLDLSRVNNEIKKTYGSVKDLKSAMEKGGPAGAAAYNQVASSILNTNLQLKQSNKLLDEMATSMANTVKWGITSAIFNNISGSIQKAYGYTKKLDTSLNDIRIVTEKSAESMEKFAVQANNAAKGLGASTLDYTQASLIYYQQGLSDEEVAARAETTLKAANVTGQSGEAVSEQLTAVWNGYKVTAQEAELYVDKLAAVAATTAADLEELSTGMSKVASAANLMGVDIDQLNAQLATIVSVTRQAPESVGTALKTIYARMGDIEAGIDTETTLGNYTEEMANMGFNVLDMNGKLRDMGEVIEEIGSKWSTMSREQQISLSQTVAGTRQYNNLLSLFDNWDTYTKAIETSSKAAGTLQKQQDIYMESTKAHLQTLSTEAERTYDILFNQDTVNGFADTLTGVLTVFNDFIEGIGGGGKAILYFGSLVANVFNQQISQSILKARENFQASIANKKGGQLKEQVIEAGVAQVNQMSGTGIDQGTEAYQAQLNAAKKIFDVRKGLTQQQYQETIEINKQIGLETKKLTQLKQESTITKDIKEGLKELGVQESTSQAIIERKLTSRKAEYDSIIAGKQALQSLSAISKQVKDNTITQVEAERQSALYLEDFKNMLTLIDKSEENIVLDWERITNEIKEGKLNLSFLQREINEINFKEEQLNSAIAAGNTLLKSRSPQHQKEIQQQQEKLRLLNQQNDAYAQQGALANRTQNLVKGGMALAGSITAVTGALQSFNAEGATTADKVQAAFSGASGIVSSIGMALGPVGMIISSIASAVIAGIGSMWAAHEREMEKAIEENKKQWEELRSTVEESNSNIDSLKSVQTEFERLSLGVSKYGENISLTADEYEKYQDIVEQVVDLNPEVVQGYTNEGKAIVDKNKLIENTIELLKQQQLEQKKALLTDSEMDKTYSRVQGDIDDAKDKVSDAEDRVSKAKINSDKNVLLEKVAATNQAFNGLGYVGSTGFLTVAENLDGNQKEQFEKEIEKFYNMAYSEDGYIDPKKIIENRENIQGFLEDLQKTYKFSDKDLWGISGTENTQQYFDNLESQITEGAEELKNAEEELKQAKESMEEVGKGLNDSVITSLEVESDVYTNLGTSQQLAIQKYVNSFSIDKADPESFKDLEEKANIFTEKIANLDEKTAEDINNLSNSNNYKSYQDYIDNLEKFVKEQIAKGDEGLTLDEIKQLFGLTSLTVEDNIVKAVDEITPAANKFKEKIQEKFQIEDFDIFKYFNTEQLEDIDLENLTIGDIDFNKFENFADFEEYYNSVIKLNQAIQQSGTSFTQAQANITSINSALEEFQKEGALTEETIKKLEGLYPELAKIQDKGSHEYLQTLRDVREQEEDNARAALEEQKKALEEKAEYYRNLDYSDLSDIKVQANIEEFENTMQKLLDTDYALQVQIEADLKSDVEDAFGIADELTKLQELVPEDLTVSFDRAQELIAQGYAGILENATETSEQSIKLDKATMNAFIDNRQAELEEDRKNKIAQLENQKTLLITQREALTKKLNALKEAKNAENAVEAVSALQKAKMADAEYQDAVELLNASLEDEANAATEEEKINEQLFNDLGGMYETNSKNEQQSEKDTTDNQAENVKSRLNNIKQLYDGYMAVAEARLYSEGAGGEPSKTVPGADSVTGGSAPETTAPEKAKGEEIKAGKVSGSEKEFTKNVQDLYNNQQEYENTVNKLIEDTESQIDALDQQIGSIDAGIAALKGADKSLDKAQKDAGKGSGGGKEDKREEEYKTKEEEIDRYWELNKAIENVTEALSDLDKKQSKLHGKELIASLKEENKLLKKQAKAYQELAAEQRKEAGELQGKLMSQGVKFDKEGGVANYQQAAQAALDKYNQAVTAYNSFAIDEATFKAEQQAYENFKATLERYEELYYNEMRDTQNELDEIHRKELENNLEAWEVKIQVKLDKKELKREWNDFFSEINEDFTAAYEDLDAKMKLLVKNAKTYTSKNGDIKTQLKAIKDVKAEIDKMENGEKSNKFESISQAQEELKKQEAALRQSASDMRDLWEESWDTYLDGIDQASDKLDHVMDQYESIDKEIEHQRKLIELLYGDEAYDLMDEYYKAQEKNTLSSIDSLKQQRDMWKQQYDQALARDKANGTTSEDTLKFYEKWQQAQDDLNGSVEDYIELLQDDYKNSIEKIISDLEKQITGGLGLDEVKEEWELLKEQSDKYYDDVERIYELSSLSNKYETSIASTSNLKNQQKLQKLYEQEMKFLEEKDNLSKHDLEMANAKYELTLKQIALEEAQQNKNAMKLVRGTDGNWSYQYVADQDEISKKQQDLMDASDKYYETAKDGYYENLDDMADAVEEYLEKIKEINITYMNDEETKNEKLAKLKERYEGPGGIITLLAKENQERQRYMAEATALTLNATYQANAKNYEWMTNEQKKLIDGLKDGTIDSYDAMLKRAEDVCANTLTAWNSAAQTMATNWNGAEKGDGKSVREQVQAAYNAIGTATDEYKGKLDALGKTTGEVYDGAEGKKGITQHINDAKAATVALEGATNNLCNNTKDKLESHRSSIEKIGTQWNSVKKEIDEAITSIDQYLAKQSSVKNDPTPAIEPTTPTTNNTTNNNNSNDKNNNNNTNNNTKKGGGGNNNVKSVSVTMYPSVESANAMYTKTVTKSNKKELKEKEEYKNYTNNWYLKLTTGEQGYISKSAAASIQKLKTGGYTGNWQGENGKLAFLHSKELVLNAKDTENILSAVDTVRQLSSLNDSINQSIMNGIGQMVLNLVELGKHGNYSIGDNSTSGNTIFEIQANFPNAGDVESIREAIMSLPNLASQYIARNKK